jgi:hypothetical protein
MQLRQMYRHNLPQAAIVETLVFVSEDVADADDGMPRRARMPFRQFGWQCACRLGNDLQGAFGHPA